MSSQTIGLARIRQIAEKHNSAALISWDTSESEVFEFSTQRRVYKLGNMRGHVQQVEPNEESTIIVFTVKKGGEMADHHHDLPLPSIETVVCMYGKFWVEILGDDGGRIRIELSAGESINHDAGRMHSAGAKTDAGILVVWAGKLPDDTATLSPLPGDPLPSPVTVPHVATLEATTQTMGIKDKFSGFKNKIIMQILTKFLAGIIDKLKVSNPTLFTIIQVILGLLFYLAEDCVEWLSVCATDAFGTYTGILQGIVVAIGFSIGSRTYPYLNKKE